MNNCLADIPVFSREEHSMTSETTEEFAVRFKLAVEGHPLAPVSAHGRQRWVLDKLKTEASLKVSPNTMSKWFHGTARPRPDNIRKIAKVLKVDEVWLSMGRKPKEQTAAALDSAEGARGAVLMMAGLIEMNGGRVSFLGKEQAPIDLHVNIGGDQFGAVIVVLSEQGASASCVVPEPVGEARILAVIQCPVEGVTAAVRIYDLTPIPRITQGGFSVMQLDRCERDDVFKGRGNGVEIAPLKTLSLPKVGEDVV
jgi:transcriptional regulator with XRE-family HTH domain